MTASYYETLNVTTKVSKVDLVLAYFARASLHHPDITSDTEGRQDFMTYSEAFAVLYDAKSRFRYDAQLKSRTTETFHVPMEESAARVLYNEMAMFIANGYAEEGLQGQEILECLLQFGCPEKIATTAVSCALAPIQTRAAKDKSLKIIRTVLLGVILVLSSLFIIRVPPNSNLAVTLFIIFCFTLCTCVFYYRRGAPYLEWLLEPRTLGMKQLNDFHNHNARYFKKPGRGSSEHTD
jgi:hypothetical protein